MTPSRPHPPLILVLNSPEAPAARLAQAADAHLRHGLELIYCDSPPPAGLLARSDAILTRGGQIDAEMLAMAAHCQVVIHLGPGIGPGATRIDLEAARASGIYVSSVPDYATDRWAAATLTLIDRTARMLKGTASADPLAGCRLGLVGFGQVGQAVARLARARGMRVRACDPFCPENPFDVLGVERTPLQECLGMTDFVSLHVPLGPATRGMIGRQELLLFQADSALINTAASSLIDEISLALALSRGRPAALALPAPPAADSPLAGLPSVLIQPGLMDHTPEDDDALMRKALSVARKTLQGERPAHLLIDPPCPRQILIMPNTMESNPVRFLN